MNEAISALHAKDRKMQPWLAAPILVNPWTGPWISVAIEFAFVLAIGAVLLWKMRRR